MNFKSWLLEYEDKDFDFYKNMVLGKLNLNKEQGLEQNLNTWDSDQLISILRGLGEYRQLPEVTRNQVEGRIKSQVGTIGDIIKIMNTGGEFNV